MEKQKNIPKLRFPEFKGEWETKEIGEILTIGNGRDYKHLKYGNIPVFGTGGLMTKVDDYLYDGETVCIGRKGTIDKPIYFNGKIWTVDTLFYTYDYKLSSVKFIYNIFQRINWKNYNEASGVPSLSKSTIEKIEITIPTLPEQTRIASFFTVLDKKIAELKQKKNLLEQYKKGVMQKLFSQELRFKDGNGNEFPEWEKKKLGEVAFKISSNIAANTIEDNFGDYIIYGASGILKRVDFFREEEEYISIVKDGAGVGRVFLCAAKSSVLGTLDIIKPLGGNLYYLFYFLQQTNFLKYVTGSTIPHIYFSDYKAEKILFPCFQEQTKIANFLSAIDEKINRTENQIQKTQEWKKGLLQRMFV